MAKKTSKATDKKEKDTIFLNALSRSGNVTRAAVEAELDRVHLYRRKREDEAFAREWDKALAIGIEALEDEAKRRAYDGWDEPVFYQGRSCGSIRKFSDTLMIVLLKAHKPEKYRENINMNVSGELNVSALERGRERAKERI